MLKTNYKKFHETHLNLHNIHYDILDAQIQFKKMPMKTH